MTKKKLLEAARALLISQGYHANDCKISIAVGKTPEDPYGQFHAEYIACVRFTDNSNSHLIGSGKSKKKAMDDLKSRVQEDITSSIKDLKDDIIELQTNLKSLQKIQKEI